LGRDRVGGDVHLGLVVGDGHLLGLALELCAQLVATSWTHAAKAHRVRLATAQAVEVEGREVEWLGDHRAHSRAARDRCRRSGTILDDRSALTPRSLPSTVEERGGGMDLSANILCDARRPESPATCSPDA